MTGQTAFNSALETGVRALALLIACHPRDHDLSRLVQYDYLIVHSADANGPSSLHPALPLRSGELLVRRGLVEAGLQLMMSKSLVIQSIEARGFRYSADDTAEAFMANLRSPYLLALRERANWVAATFDDLADAELDIEVRRLFERWTTEFQPVDSVGTPPGS